MQVESAVARTEYDRAGAAFLKSTSLSIPVRRVHGVQEESTLPSEVARCRP